MNQGAATSAPIQHEFLGWDRPALPEAARRLAERSRQGHDLDLGRVLVVVPGQRAGRRLRELLAYQAEDAGLRLTPPELVTEGTLPEKLYTPKRPFANDLVQDLAWAQALRDLPATERGRLVPHPPADGETLRWLALGRTLRQLHRELAADGLDFTAVPAAGPRLREFHEQERWQTLRAVQERYLAILDAHQLWDQQTARLKAIELGEAATACDIILLGMVDLNNTMRRLLDRVAGRVTAYIVAPPELAERFDAHGCLLPDAWCQAPVELRDDQLRQVDDALAQTEAVTAWLAEISGRFATDQVVIGVPDEALVPQLQRQLGQCDVVGRWVEGGRIGDSAPYRLLHAAAQFAGQSRYDDLAALVRHPDVEDWLDVSGSLSAELDQFYNAHLPSRVRARQVDESWTTLKPALIQIEDWLREAAVAHPLRAWGDVFCQMLDTVYGKRELDLNRPDDEVFHRVLGRLLEACEDLRALPEELDWAAFSAAEAFALVFEPLADQALPPPADPNAVQLLGWLELALDDAPALVVTSFQEGVVPKATTEDAFLPDRLRRELGLEHNERRYARDAYATAVLCASRQELRVIFARRDTKNDPVQPSRLNFACDDGRLVARAGRYFDTRPRPTAPRRLLLASADGGIPATSPFKPPAPIRHGKSMSHIAVTRFKHYIANPYRYYLRYIRGLESVDDAARELEANAFGSLLHDVLGAFGYDPDGPRHSAREKDIFDYLAEQLDALAGARYGAGQHRPAIRVQIEQARHRLRTFAPCQAQRVREGWLIAHVEHDQSLSIPFPVDGKPIDLVGRIDRIDFHEKDRKILILDYKTGDRAKEPGAAHHDGKKWIDLQLPLYRHLWRATKIDPLADSTIQFGYFNLPREAKDTAVLVADWDQAKLAEADETARKVVRALRDEIFEPAPGPVPEFDDGLGAICLDSVYRTPSLEDDENGEDPA